MPYFCKFFIRAYYSYVDMVSIHCNSCVICISITFLSSRAVVRELVETEEEFGRDMQQVVSRYMKPMDKATTPKSVFENRELLFSNFKQICEFHNT